MNGDLANQLASVMTPETLGFLASALGRTLWMTVVGCAIGFVVGMLLAIVRRTRAAVLAPLRLLAGLYVETFRRIPFLVILILVLFSVQAFAPDLSLLGIATIAVTLAATAYLTEIVGAGLDAVPRPQIESAEVLGLSTFDTLRHVVLPQAWSVILPPAAAFMVMFVKDTALASHLGVVELAFAGKILVNKGFSPLVGFGAVLVLYALISWPLGRVATYLESRLAASRHR